MQAKRQRNRERSLSVQYTTSASSAWVPSAFATAEAARRRREPGERGQPAFLTTRRSKHAIRPPGLRCACLPCSTYRSSTPARAKRRTPRPDGPLTHFASPRGETCRLAARVKSHAGGVTRPGTIGVTPSRARNVAPRSPRGRAEAARNPLGDGHLRPSALSFVGGDHPDRHPPHFAPSDRRSPPRLPRDFCHGLLAVLPTANGILSTFPGFPASGARRDAHRERPDGC